MDRYPNLSAKAAVRDDVPYSLTVRRYGPDPQDRTLTVTVEVYSTYSRAREVYDALTFPHGGNASLRVATAEDCRIAREQLTA